MRSELGLQRLNMGRRSRRERGAEDRKVIAAQQMELLILLLQETIAVGVLDLVLDRVENRAAIRLGVENFYEVEIRKLVRGRSVLEVVRGQTILVCGFAFHVIAVRRHLREPTDLHRSDRLGHALDISAVCAIEGLAVPLKKNPGVDPEVMHEWKPNYQMASRKTAVGHEELDVWKSEFGGGYKKENPSTSPRAGHCKILRHAVVGKRTLKNHRLDATYLADAFGNSLPSDLRRDYGIVLRSRRSGLWP